MCNMDSVVVPRPPAAPIGLFNFPQHAQIPAAPRMGGPHSPPPLPPPMMLRQLPLVVSGGNGRVGGGTPASPPKPESVRSKKSAGSGGFRLMENQDDTGSIYSIYKQKIDAMFESDASSSTKNSVQARIEKMFTDVAIDNGIAVTGGGNDIGCHTFSVDYLGSVPLLEKVTSLTGLQRPLKDLYFAYKRSPRVATGLSGKLEISGAGLKIAYQGEKGDLEQLNSFPTIAVWSAVKFVIHQEPKTTYAFLPLITDPDNIDKKQLFKTLDVNESKYINSESHSPLFAVVMRKIGVHKQLECHGFVCQTSEDAIVIAATLYKSLMAHMKAKEKRPKNRNGVTCMSLTSSNVNESSVPVRPPRKKRSNTSSTISDGEILDADTTPLIGDHTNDNNKPKKSFKTKRAPKAPEIDFDAILPYEEPIQPETNTPKSNSPIPEIKPAKLSDKWNTYMSQNQKQIAAEIKQISESSNMGLKRVKSLRKRNNDEIKSSTENSGDILTKVTIPRSGSFLNAGGLTRYKSKVHRSNGQVTGGSPLGFNELFNEFRLQEGLHSMDEILGVIIDSEGMSFNDLKPIYKEFLLKLAVTLTKDELYQRSKTIMRRQKKKLLRRTSSAAATKRKHIVVCSKFNKRLKHVFQKLRIVKPAPEESNCLPVNEEENDKIPESSISTSSYDTRQFRPKDVQITRKQSYRKRTSDLKAVNNRNTRRDRTSTSEESDFFSLRRSKSKTQNLLQVNQNRNSSSGYVSYSECSYDSDTCTCISADKCYCSLGTNKMQQERKVHSCKKLSRADEKCYCTVKSEHLSFCGCDTDSCTDSNKCYCNPPKGGTKNGTTSHQSTIFEQLKQRGFIPSSVSATTSPNCRKLAKKNSNTKSTRSLEYMSNPMEKYYEKLKPPKDKYSSCKYNSSRRTSASVDNLALDYEMFTHHHNHKTTCHGRSISESEGQALLEERPSRCYNQQKMVPHHHLNSNNHTHEALSVKKSAEIAALFTDIKLTQTTDIGHLPRGHQQQLIGHNPQQRYPHHQRGTSIGSHQQQQLQLQNRMVLNSLYTVRQRNGAGHHTVDGMYSTKNGLYTIQSQSDDSRGSSVRKDQAGQGKQVGSGGRYGGAGLLGATSAGMVVGGGSSLENSLGYLP